MKNALKELENLISDMNEKYHFEQDDLLKIGLSLNKIAMLSPQGTFEGESRR